jgi:hypothetical protein
MPIINITVVKEINGAKTWKKKVPHVAKPASGKPPLWGRLLLTGQPIKQLFTESLPTMF